MGTPELGEEGSTRLFHDDLNNGDERHQEPDTPTPMHPSQRSSARYRRSAGYHPRGAVIFEDRSDFLDSGAILHTQVIVQQSFNIQPKTEASRTQPLLSGLSNRLRVLVLSRLFLGHLSLGLFQNQPSCGVFCVYMHPSASRYSLPAFRAEPAPPLKYLPACGHPTSRAYTPSKHLPTPRSPGLKTNEKLTGIAAIPGRLFPRRRDSCPPAHMARPLHSPKEPTPRRDAR